MKLVRTLLTTLSLVLLIGCSTEFPFAPLVVGSGEPMPIPPDLQIVRENEQVFLDEGATLEPKVPNEHSEPLRGSFGRTGTMLVEALVQFPGTQPLPTSVRVSVWEVLVFDDNAKTVTWSEITEFPADLAAVLVSQDARSYVQLEADLEVIDSSRFRRVIRDGIGGEMVDTEHYRTTALGMFRVGISVDNAWESTVSWDGATLVIDDGTVNSAVVGVRNLRRWHRISE